MDKVRLTIEDLHKGNTLSAEKRMGKEDGGLARYTTECQSDVDWGNAEIVARERGLKQRKILEGIESLRQRYYGMSVLNNFDHVDSWKPILKPCIVSLMDPLRILVFLRAMFVVSNKLFLLS